uniref:Uncharacterized protein n=1 Tax=Glossina pallidipes TaxID=7398 RepID=A0A1A9ZNA8_GLOPL
MAQKYKNTAITEDEIIKNDYHDQKQEEEFDIKLTNYKNPASFTVEFDYETKAATLSQSSIDKLSLRLNREPNVVTARISLLGRLHVRFLSLELAQPQKSSAASLTNNILNRVHALHNCSGCRSVIVSDMCVVAESKDDVANYFHAHNPHSLHNLHDERTECGGGGDIMRPNGAGRISRISPGGTNGGGGKRIKGGGGPINGGGKNGGGGKRPIKGKLGASICNGEGAPTISSPTPVEATFDPKKRNFLFASQTHAPQYK